MVLNVVNLEEMVFTFSGCALQWVGYLILVKCPLERQGFQVVSRTPRTKSEKKKKKIRKIDDAHLNSQVVDIMSYPWAHFICIVMNPSFSAEFIPVKPCCCDSTVCNQII